MVVEPIRTEELSSVRCLQSPYWAALKSAHGWQARAFRLPHDTLLVLTRTFLHHFTLAYVPFGPSGNVSLRELGAALRSSLPRTTFLIRYDLPYGSACDASGTVPAFASIQPDATVLLDLSGGYEEVRKGYRQRARRQLKKSLPLLSIRLWDGSPSVFDRWYSLYEETGRRDGFSIRGRDYLGDVLGIDTPLVHTKLFLAWMGDELVGGTILLYGPEEAIYLFGASARLKECTASHALQDAMVRYACGLGIPRYDFYGCSASDGRGAHLASLDLFKTSFGGRRVDRRPTLDLPLMPWAYRAYALLERRRYTASRAR